MLSIVERNSRRFTCFRGSGNVQFLGWLCGSSRSLLLLFEESIDVQAVQLTFVAIQQSFSIEEYFADSPRRGSLLRQYLQAADADLEENT
jgi:hypothetical protein